MTVEWDSQREDWLRIHLPEQSVLADFSVPHGVPLDDPTAAVAAAVEHPLDFPPLRQAAFPGDRIVLAVDQGVPRTPEVVAGVVHALLAGGISPESLEIVRAAHDGDLTEDAASALPAVVREAITLSHHDPTNLDALAYLAASKEGKPIYFNRRICDADVVIPISTLRLDDCLGYVGVYSGLFPTFSDEQTQQRFRAPSSADWSAHRRRRREEAEEAAWLLGVQFTLQVMPGAGNSLLGVLAGDAHAVAKRGAELCVAAWRHKSPTRASLVVASIEGGPEQQTWENFGRALFSASQAVQDGGAIVLCTHLRCQPGPALQRLSGSDDWQAVLHELRRERCHDATSAALLAETRERFRVYLLSDLDAELVEGLGIAPVSCLAEVERLGRQHDSCILLGNAQYAWLAAEE